MQYISYMHNKNKFPCNKSCTTYKRWHLDDIVDRCQSLKMIQWTRRTFFLANSTPMTTPFLTSYTWLWVVVSENEALVYPSFFTSSQLLKFVPIAEKLCHIFMLIGFFQACDDWKYIVFLMVFGGLAFLLKKINLYNFVPKSTLTLNYLHTKLDSINIIYFLPSSIHRMYNMYFEPSIKK